MERGYGLGGGRLGLGSGLYPRAISSLALELGWAPREAWKKKKGSPHSLEYMEKQLQMGWLFLTVSSILQARDEGQPFPGSGSGLVLRGSQPLLTRGCPSESSQEAGGHGSGTPGPSPWRRFWWNLGLYKLGPAHSLHGISESWQGLEVGVGPGHKAC